MIEHPKTSQHRCRTILRYILLGGRIIPVAPTKEAEAEMIAITRNKLSAKVFQGPDSLRYPRGEVHCMLGGTPVRVVSSKVLVVP